VGANIILAAVYLLAFGMWSNHLRQHRPTDARPGTSHWAPADKLRPYIAAAREAGALPLGRIRAPACHAGAVIALPPMRRFAHIGVWGVTEAGKTTGVYKPFLMTDAGLNDPTRPFGAMSSVAIDMKHPDLYDTLAPYIAPLPRRFYVLAPGSPDVSMSYNALDHLDPNDTEAYKSDVDALAFAIVENTVFAHKDVPYYRAMETRLLQYLIQFAVEADGALSPEQLHVLFAAHLLRGQRMPPVRSFPFLALLSALGRDEFFAVVHGAITDPDQPDLWMQRFKQFAELPKQDVTGLLHGLQRRLGAFALPEVAKISVHSPRLRLDTLGTQPTTLIIGMQTVNTETIQTYSALILTQLIQQLVRLADRSPGRRLPVPVTIYLDEIANAARIPTLEDNIATLRDKGIAFVLGLQDDSGLRQRYSEEAARKIIANLNTKIVLGRNLDTFQAEDVVRRAGETTILTHSASGNALGESRSLHAARRGLVTVDMLRRMEQYEALVFLQEGYVTKTRLYPLPRRDVATGAWFPVHGTRNERALYRYWRGRLAARPFATEMARPPALGAAAQTAAAADGTPAPVWPIVRLRRRDVELDAVLGPVIAPRAPDARPALAPSGVGQAGAAAAGPVAPAPWSAPSPDPGGAVMERLAPEADAGSSVATDATAAPPAAAAPDPVVTSPEGSVEPAGSVGEPSASPSLDANALGEMTGFFRAILTKKIVAEECERVDASPGWRATLSDGSYVLVRYALLAAYGERRRTRPDDIAARWRAAGLIAPGRVDVRAAQLAISVVAFTPLAESRLIPAIRDDVSSWPVVTPRDVRGLGVPRPAPTAPEPGANGPAPEPTLSPAAALNGQVARSEPAVSKTDPDAALQIVIAWAKAHRAALQADDAPDDLGRWDTITYDQSVLLVRQQQLARLLMQRHVDYQVVLTAWRDSDVIVTAKDRGRFTVYQRVDGREQQGTRFIAFSWKALEAAGLGRGRLAVVPAQGPT